MEHKHEHSCLTLIGSRFPYELSASDIQCTVMGACEHVTACLQCRDNQEVRLIIHEWNFVSVSCITIWPYCSHGSWNADECSHLSSAAVCLNECTYHHTFWRSGTDFILIFFRFNGIAKFQGESHLRGVIIYGGGWENLLFFHHKRRLSRKWYKIGPWLLWITNREW